MYIFIERDIWNNVINTRTFGSETRMMSALRKDMVKSMQNIEAEHEHCIAILKAFDKAKQLEVGRWHERTVESASVEFIRNTNGYFTIEAYLQDEDGDKLREWIVTHINPTVITN